jgi:microcystin degradation protein MlrC
MARELMPRDRAPRILIAGLYHEGNRFSRVVTDRNAIAVVEGDALIARAETTGASIGGAYRFLKTQGASLIPALSAVTPPGGPIADAVYQDLRDRIVAGARETAPDGVYLDLHGAMLTQSLDDPEGDLLVRLREAVGGSVPIAVSLDLHAYVTDRMLAHADIILACKENPHSDYDLAGERAAELLIGKLRDDIAPVTAAVWVPLVFGCRMETAKGPLKHLHDRRRAFLAAESSLLDVSICNVHTLVDGERAWQCITAIADNDAALAARVASDLAHDLWSRRDDFTPEFVPLAAILDDVAAGRTAKPVIIGDQGDRVLAGTPGDGVTIISELVRNHPKLRAVVPITDPQTVTEAKAAGIGALLQRAIGGTLSDGLPSFPGLWRVASLSDGNFVQAGPYLARENAHLGDTAVLQSGNLTVIATSLPGFSQDREAFRSQGIVLEQQDVVVTKSGYHFKLSFADIGPCVVADTPGISNYRPGLIPYRTRRPIYPEDRIEEPTFVPSLYPPRQHRGGHGSG